jgi:hypothetical protein
MEICTVRHGSLPGCVPLQLNPLAEDLVLAYLDRLGVSRTDVATANLTTLNMLMKNHVNRVCYT